ncbi:unnamed protein product [Cercopithifilaria johnstoni]|uniref:Uncharacterized protein n=1 Tax=Cercopithifilaria johnstoni TaxID=2874296 RepID=A0A8J2LYG0_9BILA|nr:unnamed protein product [Cercopithifilaria johnstoni]
MPHNGSFSIFLPEPSSGYCISRMDENFTASHRHQQKTEPMNKHLRRFRLDSGFRSLLKSYCHGDTATVVNSSKFIDYDKNGERKIGSRTAVRSYPTYTENSFGKSMSEYLRTDSVPILNFKQSFSTLRRFKRPNLG